MMIVDRKDECYIKEKNTSVSRIAVQQGGKVDNEGEHLRSGLIPCDKGRTVVGIVN